jgi:hypothetical protein
LEEVPVRMVVVSHDLGQVRRGLPISGDWVSQFIKE